MADDSMRSRKGDLFLYLRTDEGTMKILARKAERSPRNNELFEKLSNAIADIMAAHYADTAPEVVRACADHFAVSPPAESQTV